MGESRYRDLSQRLQVVLMLMLVGSVGWFVWKTIHWPLAGDASLMHYVGFLMDHGRAPYKDIGDMNLPLSYAPAWVMSHLFGTGYLPWRNLPWRLYDLLLLIIAGAAMYIIVRPQVAFPAVWAGCLFALIHGRDGLLQVGQRDLAAAVLSICGVACLFGAMRGSRSWLAAGFGVCTGSAAMIKPTFAAFLLLAFVEYFVQRNDDSRLSKRLRYAVLGWLAPVFGCVVWLGAKGALGAFCYAFTVVGPYHAKIGHAPTKFLFSNSVSPIGWLIAAWLIVRLGFLVRSIRRNGRFANTSLERNLLLFATALGYLSYLVQQRGYPYHRYPFQVFLLMVMALDFTDALHADGWMRWTSAVALVWAAVVLAPISAVKAGRYEWRQQPFRVALKADLLHVERDRNVASLNGRVECLDSISGCVAALDEMRVVENDSVIYDEFLFNPAGERVVDDARAHFLADVEKNPPLAFVESAPLFPAGPDAYKKLDRWPEFREWLNTHYMLEEERTFTIAVREAGKPTVPPGYRIYLQK